MGDRLELADRCSRGLASFYQARRPPTFAQSLKTGEFAFAGGTILLNAHCVGIGIYSGAAPRGISE
jgi:hypothetical protein